MASKRVFHIHHHRLFTAVGSPLGLVFCYVLIVETKGLSLEGTATLSGGENACGCPSGDEKDTEESVSQN